MNAVARPTYKSALQGIYERYRREVKGGEVDLKDVSAWAIKLGLWEPPKKSAVDILARDMGRALRDEYFTDPQGRRVRKKHARKISKTLPSGEMEQQTLWDDMTTAKPEHMQISFQQRRGMALDDCHQLKTDADSYNENYNPGDAIQLSWDFTEDLEELEMPTTYRDSASKDEDDKGNEEEERI